MTKKLLSESQPLERQYEQLYWMYLEALEEIARLKKQIKCLKKI